jgi:hypothetical protein
MLSRFLGTHRNTPEKARLLQQIAAIPAMERGKLCEHTIKERPQAGPYHKLQQWQDGRNRTRYVSGQELPAVKSAIEGYAQFQQLTGQYADLVVDETRRNLADSKKNKSPRKFSSPRRRKSGG